MLGDLSAKYESSGDPGSVSDGTGDPGGKSYGAYQLSLNVGSLETFVAWMCEAEDAVTRQYGEALAVCGLATEMFDAKWHEIAELDGETFLRQQHQYIEEHYYCPAVEFLATAMYHVEQHHAVMQEVVWSRTVKYGAGLIVEMFEAAVKALGYPNLPYVDSAAYDAAMIEAVYMRVCRTEEWTVESCRIGLYRRFVEEEQEALAMLRQEEA
jgi:hypothetical protein